MAHHQQTNHQRIIAAPGLSSGNFSESTGIMMTGDDELVSDVDEPPDQGIQFAKLRTATAWNCNSNTGGDYAIVAHATRERKESLLTQALLSSPEIYPMSEAEAPVLTSDGGLTSPARTSSPSPPLLSSHTGLAVINSKECQSMEDRQISDAVQIVPAMLSEPSHETSVEAGLGRKRCISFACGRQSASRRSGELLLKSQPTAEHAAKASSPPKRPCILKFACPMKPFRAEPHIGEKREKSPCPAKPKSSAGEGNGIDKAPELSSRPHRDSKSTIRSNPSQKAFAPPTAVQSRKGRVFNRVDFQNSEATRFHEFACYYNVNDEWTNEQTAYRQKITVNDTLRKENAIRKLAEEAEEEALDEEAGEDVVDDDDDDNMSDNEDETIFDDGNETDDEEGFADSDEEMDEGSDYQFWTPGLTTAATSTDHLEHIRPVAHRVASDSSIESTIKTQKMSSAQSSKEFCARYSRMCPETPVLPDSSEFVVGTVDEDRPLEEAYMSCLEERRRSKHKLTPQDIDPSFPTSEPEVDKDDDDDDGADGREGKGKVDNGGNNVFSAPESVDGLSQTAHQKGILSRSQNPTPTRSTRLSVSPLQQQQSSVPKRLRSPPFKRVWLHQSPPPRRLFGQCTHRMRSPPPIQRKLRSPPSSRRPSFNGSTEAARSGIEMPHLAQRPNLTHTTSLPRTPNPFWSQHQRSRLEGTDTASTGTSPKSMKQQRVDAHSRGPIDIVQGLETKRQRRKDKFWRQHCRTVGKEKDRRCQPGKGAERMKELGLEMADRFRGYGQRAQLVLSV